MVYFCFANGESKRMKGLVYRSKSDKETQDIGYKFAGKLKAGDIVLLYGDLGFGKTTFVKGVARGLGIKSRIISPTFVLVRLHKTEPGVKGLGSSMTHIDLYRLEGKHQLEEIGIGDIIYDKNSIKLIEWAENLDFLPKKRWEVKFGMGNINTRTIEILKYD